MATETFFSYVSPDGLDRKTRLNKGRYAYQRAGENLGLAAGPIAAEWSIEQSPGHRRNLLDPNFSRIGIGVAFSKREHPQALVTEILAKPPAQGRDPVEETYRSVQQKRADLHLPALKRNEVLEQLALEHVHRALELGQPKPELPGDSLQEQIFSSLHDVSRTSVEFFVSDSPPHMPTPNNLTDRNND